MPSILRTHLLAHLNMPMLRTPHKSSIFSWNLTPKELPMPCPLHPCLYQVCGRPSKWGKPGVGHCSQNNPSFSYLSLSHAGTLTTIPAGLIESSAWKLIQLKRLNVLGSLQLKLSGSAGYSSGGGDWVGRITWDTLPPYHEDTSDIAPTSSHGI